ncbi:hypothetical protein O3M35_007445 [Rhynocoris fuscipes]|uniref:Uncharacterized protein n=1 Tax=Rhynocoris fuscipes TaxID=488301 RepID=A0AAW1DC49_9HEMI
MRDLKPYLDEDEELEYANDYESIDNMKEQQSTYKTLIANVSTSNSNIVNQSISTTKKYETFSEFYDDMSGKSSKLKPKKFRPDFEKYFTKEVHVLMAFVVLIVVQIIVLILLLWNCYLHYRLVKQACKARPTVRLGNKSNESIQSERTATTYHCPEINCGANNIGRAVGGGDALDLFHPANITSDVTPSTSAEMAARKLKHPIVAKKKSFAPSSISSSDLGSFTVTIYLNQ